MIHHIRNISATTKINSATVNNWQHIKHWQIHNFSKQAKLIWADASAYAKIVLSSIKKGKVDDPIAQCTKFEWIVFGTACEDDTFKLMCNAVNKMPPIVTPICTHKCKGFGKSKRLKQQGIILSMNNQLKIYLPLVTSAIHLAMLDLPFKVDPNSDCLGESKVGAQKDWCKCIYSAVMAKIQQFNKCTMKTEWSTWHLATWKNWNQIKCHDNICLIILS